MRRIAEMSKRRQRGAWNIALTQQAAQGGGGGDLFSLPLYNTSKISYDGMFLLPQDGSALNGDAGLGYGGRPAGIAFNPAGNGGAGSLFISGGPESYPEVVGEFSIPTAKTSAPYNTSAVLQALQYTAAGKQGQIQNGSLGTVSSGLMVYNGRLIESWLSFYLNTADSTQTTAYLARNNLTLSGGTATDAVQVGTLTNQRFMSGLGCALPQVWQDAFGGYKAIGGGAGGVSISGNYSCGPAMVLFNPDEITGSGIVAGKELSYYQQGDIDSGFGPYSSLWTNNSFHRGIITLPESRTIICFGRHGDSIYNGGNNSVVQCRTRLWLYDAIDAKQVYDGLLSPRAILPYATFDINEGPNNVVPQGDEIRSCTWDLANRRCYVRANHEDGSWPAVFRFTFAA